MLLAERLSEAPLRFTFHVLRFILRRFEQDAKPAVFDPLIRQRIVRQESRQKIVSSLVLYLDDELIAEALGGEGRLFDQRQADLQDVGVAVGADFVGGLVVEHLSRVAFGVNTRTDFTQ